MPFKIPTSAVHSIEGVLTVGPFSRAYKVGARAFLRVSASSTTAPNAARRSANITNFAHRGSFRLIKALSISDRASAAGWQDRTAALPESDAALSRALTIAPQDDAVIIMQKTALFSVGELDGPFAV